MSSPDDRDFNRPLAPGAQFGIGQVCNQLEAGNLKPDIIITSPARRTAETAARIAQNLNFSGKIITNRQLYNASAQTILGLIEKYCDPGLITGIIGHNPAMSQVPVRLLPNFHQTLPPAAAVAIEFPDPPVVSKTNLIGYFTP